MSNVTGDEGSFSSGNIGDEVLQKPQERQQQQNGHLHGSTGSTASVTTTNSNGSSSQQPQQPAVKKKRNLPGTPDPTAEVIALSPTTLMATNRFVCEICNKGFQRDQNLQLHRRGHNLPWKLRQRTSAEVKKRVYICPEPSCVHHNPARALGDLTGIKKHYSRKHGEKKWKCDKCSKKYAVQSDWKAHQKTCGTREYKCDCGTIFSRRDSFITHRAFCDALAEENNKVNNQGMMNSVETNVQGYQMPELMSKMPPNSSMALAEINNIDPTNHLTMIPQDLVPIPFKAMNMNMVGGMFTSSSGTLFGNPRSISSSSSSSGLQLSSNSSSSFNYYQDNKNGGGLLSGSAQMSATALLQKAAQMGASASNSMNSPMMQKGFVGAMAGPDHQLSGTRTTNYGYDNFQTHQDQSTLVGNNGSEGFNSQILQKNQQEVNQMFDPGNNTGSVMHDVSMYGGLLVGGDQNAGFMKNVEHDHDHTGSNSLMQGRASMQRSPATDSSRVGTKGNSMLTLDLLGIGGSRSPSLHAQQQQQQQQRLEFEEISRQRMQVMNPFHQQPSHGESAVEKPIWDI